MHLLDLPVELLEKILLLVPPRTLIARVSVTCRRLRELLQNELFWRRRYAIQARTPLPLSESWRHWQLGSVQNEFARVLGGGERNMHASTLTGTLATGLVAHVSTLTGMLATGLVAHVSTLTGTLATCTGLVAHVSTLTGTLAERSGSQTLYFADCM